MTTYDERFYAYHDHGARHSAAAVVPLVMEIAHPASVVDVGCGTGTWLAEFRKAGVEDYLGIDGDYVERRLLDIDADRFLGRDLAQPLELDRTFDLAACLEVAEHLPEDKAEVLVASLVRLSPLVLFSAAIPFQQGEGHVNEQWPEYWRDHFARHDYVAVDVLRDAIWQNSAIEPWYRQNLLFFADRARVEDYPPLAAEFQRAGQTPYLSRVHPEHVQTLFENAQKRIRNANRRAAEARLNLREINLLAFPDWNLPPDALLAQLRALLTSAVGHPDSQRLALVISIGRDTGSLGTRLLSQVHGEVLMPGGKMLAPAPGVNAVGGPKFSPADWEALLDCVQGRIVLSGEDAAAIESAGAGALPRVSFESIQRREPIVLEPLA